MRLPWGVYQRRDNVCMKFQRQRYDVVSGWALADW
jgi:hypothetical protein